MEYNDQFIRLNCSLLSDYKMMKLSDDMEYVGIGLYIGIMLFLRKQEDYKHDLNELDLLAKRWNTTVEKLKHLIKDFDLFEISEDGYFSCKYLNEVMELQQKISGQRAASGSKGGRSSKKTSAKTASKASTKASIPSPEKEEEDSESKAKNNDEKSSEKNEVKNAAQSTDSEHDNTPLEASAKQMLKREEKKKEKRREEKMMEKKKKTTASKQGF